MKNSLHSSRFWSVECGVWPDRQPDSLDVACGLISDHAAQAARRFGGTSSSDILAGITILDNQRAKEADDKKNQEEVGTHYY